MTTDKMASRLDACSSVRERVARVFTDDRVVFVVVFEELVDARSSARGTVVVVDIMALGRASKSGETLRDVVSSRYKSYRYKSLVHAFRVVLMRRRGNHALSSVRPDVPSVSSFSNAASKFQYKDPSGQLMMLPSDIALIEDPKFKRYVDAYAKSQDEFFADFAAAFEKLETLGTSGLTELNA